MSKSIPLFLAMVAALSGCNKDSSSNSASAHGGDSIAMVNPGRIANAMGWAAEMEKNSNAAVKEVSRQVEAHITPSRAMLDQKKAQIFAAAKLTKEQMDQLSNHPITRPDMEKMGLTPQQVEELFQVASTWQNEQNSGRAAVQQAMVRHNGAIQNAFSDAIMPVIRRVAKDKGKVAVFQDGQGIPGILYLDGSIDMTDAVIAEIQKSPSIKLNLPDPPKLEWNATQPAQGVSAAATMPATPLPPTTQK